MSLLSEQLVVWYHLVPIFKNSCYDDSVLHIVRLIGVVAVHWSCAGGLDYDSSRWDGMLGIVCYFVRTLPFLGSHMSWCFLLVLCFTATCR